jgi:hypothetical protein
LPNQKCIPKPDCLIKSLVILLIFDCIEISIQSWHAIIWIAYFLHILLFFPDVPWMCICFGLSLKDHIKMLRCKLGRWAHTRLHVTVIKMLAISQAGNHWQSYLCVQYNQFYLFNQNLH